MVGTTGPSARPVRRQGAVWLIALAAVSWGTTGATMALVSRGSAVSPLLVGFLRMAVAAPCLLAVALLAEAPLRPPGPVERRRLAVAGLAMAAYQVGYFWGVTQTGVAVASLIAICSAPLLITVLATRYLGERLAGPAGWALGLGVAGATLLILGPGGARPRGALPGMLAALGAGGAYALYAVTVKQLIDRVPPVLTAAMTFGVAALALSPVPFLLPTALDGRTVGLLLYLGLGPTALAYVLYVVGLRRTPVTVAGVLSLLEPLTATALGVACFGDRLGWLRGLGAGLLVLGVALLSSPPRAPRS